MALTLNEQGTAVNREWNGDNGWNETPASAQAIVNDTSLSQADRTAALKRLGDSIEIPGLQGKLYGQVLTPSAVESIVRAGGDIDPSTLKLTGLSPQQTTQIALSDPAQQQSIAQNLSKWSGMPAQNITPDVIQKYASGQMPELEQAVHGAYNTHDDAEAKAFRQKAFKQIAMVVGGVALAGGFSGLTNAGVGSGASGGLGGLTNATSEFGGSLATGSAGAGIAANAAVAGGLSGNALASIQALSAQGLSAAEIASQLGLSASQIETGLSAVGQGALGAGSMLGAEPIFDPLNPAPPGSPPGDPSDWYPPDSPRVPPGGPPEWDGKIPPGAPPGTPPGTTPSLPGGLPKGIGDILGSIGTGIGQALPYKLTDPYKGGAGQFMTNAGFQQGGVGAMPNTLYNQYSNFLQNPNSLDSNSAYQQFQKMGSQADLRKGLAQGGMGGTSLGVSGTLADEMAANSQGRWLTAQNQFANMYGQGANTEANRWQTQNAGNIAAGNLGLAQYGQEANSAMNLADRYSGIIGKTAGSIAGQTDPTSQAIQNYLTNQSIKMALQNSNSGSGGFSTLFSK